ncbi:polymorphic toxin-type HINT domain-containing protein [Streptomyces bobili]
MDDEKVRTTATDGHPFWVPALGRWVEAGELTAGQELRTPAGERVRITAADHTRQSAAVHNLTIAELHTYYVRAGSVPVLVHNCGGCFTGHADSCTCEGIGDITYQGIDEAEDVADAADDLTSHAMQRLR